MAGREGQFKIETKATHHAPKSKSKEVEELRSHLKSLGLLEEKEKIAPAATTFEKTIIGVMRPRDKVYWRALTNVLFGGFWKISPEYFRPLKEAVDSSQIKLLPDTYISIMTAASFAAAFFSFVTMLIISPLLKLGLALTVLGTIAMPFLVFAAAFTVFYAVPFYSLNQKRVSIDANMPFAINHMAAIAASGIPPEKSFEMLVEFRDYEAISDEAENIVKRIQVLGEDITVAIREVAKKTPSSQFREFLYGVLTIIEGGGNLKEYMQEMAKLALFNYKLARKRYTEQLTMYADLYTAILIAAPLFLVAVMAVMNIIPGATFGGMSIDMLMSLGTYVFIPVVNVVFIVFISITQPRM